MMDQDNYYFQVIVCILLVSQLFFVDSIKTPCSQLFMNEIYRYVIRSKKQFGVASQSNK